MKSFLNLVTLLLAALKLVFQPARALLSLLKEQGRGGKRGGLPNRFYYLPGLCKPFGICFEKLSAQGAADASHPTTGWPLQPWACTAFQRGESSPRGNPDHPMARVRGRADWSDPLRGQKVGIWVLLGFPGSCQVFGAPVAVLAVELTLGCPGVSAG